MKPKIESTIHDSSQNAAERRIADWFRSHNMDQPVPLKSPDEAISRSKKLGLNGQFIDSLKHQDDIESRRTTTIEDRVIHELEMLDEGLKYIRGYRHKHGKINHNILMAQHKKQEDVDFRKEWYDYIESSFNLLPQEYDKEGLQEYFHKELSSTLEESALKRKTQTVDFGRVKSKSEKLDALKRTYEIELKREFDEVSDTLAVTRLGESLMIVNLMKNINSKVYETTLHWYADNRKKLLTVYSNKLINPAFDELETAIARLSHEARDQEERAEILKTHSLLQRIGQTARDTQEALEKAYDDLPIRQQIITLEEGYKQKQAFKNAQETNTNAQDVASARLRGEKEAIDGALGLNITKKIYRKSEPMQEMKIQAHDVLGEEWLDAEDTSKVLSSLLSMAPEKFRDLLDRLDEFNNDYRDNGGVIGKNDSPYDVYGLFEKMSSPAVLRKYYDTIHAVYGESAPDKINTLNNMIAVVNEKVSGSELNDHMSENELTVNQVEASQAIEPIPPITAIETEVFPTGVGPERAEESTARDAHSLVYMNVTGEELKNNEALLAKIKGDLEYAGYDTEDFDPTRMLWLLEINNAWSGQLRRSPDLYMRDDTGNVIGKNPNGWLSGSPYFISTIVDEGVEYHICESPMVGNRTYLFRADMLPGDIQEVLTLSKDESVEFGIRFNHKGKYSAADYRDKVLDRITQLNRYISNQAQKRESERKQREKLEFEKKVQRQNEAVETLRAAGFSDQEITELLKLR